MIARGYFSRLRSELVNIEQETHNLRQRVDRDKDDITLDPIAERNEAIRDVTAKMTASADELKRSVAALQKHPNAQVTADKILSICRTLAKSCDASVNRIEDTLEQYGYKKKGEGRANSEKTPRKQGGSKTPKKSSAVAVAAVENSAVPETDKSAEEGSCEAKDDSGDSAEEDSPSENIPKTPLKALVKEETAEARTPTMEDFGITALTMNVLRGTSTRTKKSISMTRSTESEPKESTKTKPAPEKSAQSPTIAVTTVSVIPATAKPVESDPSLFCSIPPRNIDQSEWESLPSYLTKQVSYELINDALQCIYAFVACKAKDHIEPTVNQSEIRDELEMENAAKAILLVLVRLQRLRIVSHSDSNAVPSYCVVPSSIKM